jgi:hypothetical protein
MSDVALAGEKLQRVREHGPQHREPVATPPARAREVHDQRRPVRARHAPRQQRVRRALRGVGADRLGQAGRLPLEHVARRLGRDVPGRETGPAGGEDEARSTRELCERRRDRLAIVRDDAPLDLEPLGPQELVEQLAAAVFAAPLGDAVRDREDGGSQTASFVFSSKRTSPMTMAESTALAMS